MRVLVTGASSMMGRGVVAKLVARDDAVVTLQRTAGTWPSAVEEYLGSVAQLDLVRRAADRCDAVVHLAAKVGITGPVQEFIEVNVEGTRTVLAAAQAAGVRRFVHISSPSVAHAGQSLVGAPAGRADPSATRGHYSTTKAIAELDALAANSSHFAVAVLRPHLVWGPGDTQLVGRIVERSRQGRLAYVGSGTALVDSTYITNAVEAVVAALDHTVEAAGEPLVVTNGEPRPIGELIDGILAAHGLEPPSLRIPVWIAKGLGWGAERAWSRFDLGGEPPMTVFTAEQLGTAHWFDQRRTRQVLRWQPRISIDEGLTALAVGSL
ncbi:MAG: NAD-dependent epimerase/dehydratase family protein [Acidimicrobiales bacterium]|nr:NAD-dependent epimerase/dehydratase family protein [Acidimicrobiales bacterium]